MLTEAAVVMPWQSRTLLSLTQCHGNKYTESRLIYKHNTFFIPVLVCQLIIHCVVWGACESCYSCKVGILGKVGT